LTNGRTSPDGDEALIRIPRRAEGRSYRPGPAPTFIGPGKWFFARDRLCGTWTENGPAATGPSARGGGGDEVPAIIDPHRTPCPAAPFRTAGGSGRPGALVDPERARKRPPIGRRCGAETPRIRQMQEYFDDRLTSLNGAGVPLRKELRCKTTQTVPTHLLRCWWMRRISLTWPSFPPHPRSGYSARGLDDPRPGEAWRPGAELR